jgi:hypothetical protein
MYQWYVSTYVVSYVKLVANSSTTKPQCTGPVHAIMHNTKEWYQSFVYIGNGSVPDPSNQIMEPMAVATQPRPTPCYNCTPTY